MDLQNMEKGAGRPPKHTPEKLAAILDCISQRVPYVLCAESNGITEKTFYHWLDEGYRDTENGIESDLSKFLQSIKDIERQRISDHLSKIDANVERWQADAWILERRWYKYFGANVHLHEMDDRLKKIEHSVANKDEGNGKETKNA